MEIYQKDLAKMSRADRKRALNQLAEAATVHRDKESPLMHLLHVIQGLLPSRRASR